MSVKARLIEAMRAELRLRQDRRYGRVTETEFLTVEVERLRQLHDDTSNGIRPSQTKWMPPLQPLSSRVYSGN